MAFQVAYVPIGVGTFHLESAQDQFDRSVAMLKTLSDDCVFPEKMLLTIDDLDAYLDTLHPDLIVLQNITFANAAYASEVVKRFTCPIVLWTLREPVIDGTRLRLNSLTGAYSAANAITASRGEGKFEYIFGAPGEEEVVNEIGAAIRAAKVKDDLNRLKMVSIGHTPQGFGFGRALDAEMMHTFGTPVCTVLSLLNANGVSASCESDAYGALSMFIGSQLTGKACFFGDPVSMDEKEGTVTFWHCGMAACNLARKDTGAQVVVHPNRKIGPVMDFGCEACEQVTLFRVGRKPDGSFRFFIAEGAALDKPKQFNGTSVVVRTNGNAKDVVYGTVKGGWEPHYVVVYGAVANELEKLGRMLDVEICKF